MFHPGVYAASLRESLYCLRTPVRPKEGCMKQVGISRGNSSYKCFHTTGVLDLKSSKRAREEEGHIEKGSYLHVCARMWIS